MENLSALEPRYTVLCLEHLLFDVQNGTWFVKTIRASGQVRRANRPDTRPHLTNINRIRNVLLSRSLPHRTKRTSSSMARKRFLPRAVTPTTTSAQSLSSSPRRPLWTPSVARQAHAKHTAERGARYRRLAHHRTQRLASRRISCLNRAFSAAGLHAPER
jgi:hypothetical protein